MRGSEQSLYARFATDDVSARVELPRGANRGFVVSSTHAGTKHFDVTATPIGAAAVSAVVERGLVHYKDIFGAGTDAFHRVTPAGTEDYVSFPSAPARAELKYQIALGEDVAGLRLVTNTLEGCAAAGTPRLRVSSPYGVDANGKTFAAELAPEGRTADTDPRAPWGHPVVPADSKSCSVVGSWNSNVAYPATVDPAWTTTGDMSATNIRWELRSSSSRAESSSTSQARRSLSSTPLPRTRGPTPAQRRAASDIARASSRSRETSPGAAAAAVAATHRPARRDSRPSPSRRWSASRSARVAVATTDASSSLRS
jgi:hypothetical protein